MRVRFKRGNILSKQADPPLPTAISLHSIVVVGRRMLPIPNF